MHEEPPQKLEIESAIPEPTPEPSEVERTLKPKIYVASLADYNNGRLHGTWLDATLDTDGLLERIQTMLDQSPEPNAEDWAIHDHDNFAGINLGEHENLETVSRLACALAEHGPAFAGLVDVLGIEDATEDAFNERYLGVWTSVTAYAEDLAEQCDVEYHLDQLPTPMRSYVRFDAEALARDMQLGGEVYARQAPEGVHIFSCL